MTNHINQAPASLADAEPEKELDDNKEQTPIIINGAQDFKGESAYIAITYKELEGFKFNEHQYLVSSDKLKIPFTPEMLYKYSIIAERKPFLRSATWDAGDLEKFLSGDAVLSMGELHSEIVQKLKSHVDFHGEGWHDFTSLWVIGTYFHRMFPSYPYVHLNGNAGTGKTKCMTLIAALSFNGELSVNSTPSYLIRLVHDSHSTCCLDEVEKLQQAKDEESKTILAMLNSGYKRGAYVGKSEQKRSGGNWELKRFEAYSPKVIAGIQGLPASLASRCIPIIMLRSVNKAVVNQEVDEASPRWQHTRNNLYRAALTYHGDIERAYQKLTDDELLGRSWELWRPILAIATCVGGDIYQKVRELALQTESRKKDIETEVVVTPTLLKALYDLLGGDGVEMDYYPIRRISEYLVAYDSDIFGWLGEDKNKNRRGKWVTNQLRIAGVLAGKTEQMKFGSENVRVCLLDRSKIKELLERQGIPMEEKDKPRNEQPFKTLEELADEIPF
ncbi:MAG: hypothetical protein M1400_01610 [Patescibacteria group bacterium]|nr:hypothetical protein [Patescibacteria group bacterium]